MNLMIRMANPEDAQKMIEYLKEVGGESDNLLMGKNEFDLTVEQEANFIQNQYATPDCRMFLGLIDEEIISIAGINSSRRKRVQHISELAISVRKKYWGQGVGRRMMNTMIDFAKSQNKEIIHLGVKASNAPAIHLYESLGFKRIGEFPNFFKINGVYDNEYLYILNLKGDF